MFCEQCGKPISRLSAAFCSNCGAPLSQEQIVKLVNPATDAPPSRKQGSLSSFPEDLFRPDKRPQLPASNASRGSFRDEDQKRTRERDFQPVRSGEESRATGERQLKSGHRGKSYAIAAVLTAVALILVGAAGLLLYGSRLSSQISSDSSAATVSTNTQSSAQELVSQACQNLESRAGEQLAAQAAAADPQYQEFAQAVAWWTAYFYEGNTPTGQQVQSIIHANCPNLP